MRADRLDRLVEVELAAVELDAGLGGDGLGDLGGGDRAEELALGAGAGRDGDRPAGTSARGDLLGGGAVAGVLTSRPRRIAVGLGLDARRWP